jgi:plastocyanin
MKRRDFLKIATGSAGGAAAVGAAGAQSSPSSSAVLQQEEGNNSTDNGTTTGNGTAGNETTTTGGGGGGGTTKTVAVGPNSENVFEPATVYVAPGDTVEWVWEDEQTAHNVNANDVPEEADWDVTTETVTAPFEYSHTFEGPTGEYGYVCDPHAAVGMEGTVVVNESGQPPEGEGGGGGRTPHEMGVPFQAHYVGIATILMVIVSLVYSFFALKYGESRHASAPNKE